MQAFRKRKRSTLRCRLRPKQRRRGCSDLGGGRGAPAAPIRSRRRARSGRGVGVRRERPGSVRNRPPIPRLVPEVQIIPWIQSKVVTPPVERTSPPQRWKAATPRAERITPARRWRVAIPLAAPITPAPIWVSLLRIPPRNLLELLRRSTTISSDCKIRAAIAVMCVCPPSFSSNSAMAKDLFVNYVCDLCRCTFVALCEATVAAVLILWVGVTVDYSISGTQG